MYLRLVRRSLFRERLATALMVASVASGTLAAATLAAIALDVDARVAEELRAYGANITIEPRLDGLADLTGQRRTLREEDLPAAKTIFWRHNIVGLAPFLDVPVAIRHGARTAETVAVGTWGSVQIPVPGQETTFEAGLRTVAPGWVVEGSPVGEGGVALGALLAERLEASIGSTVNLGDSEVKVTSIVHTGTDEDLHAFLELDQLQGLAGLQGRLSRVWVSALTTPLDDLAYRDPETMSATEYELWYCTGYATSIAAQLEEVFEGSRARPIWPVAEAEGKVQRRLGALLYPLAAAALGSSALGMTTTMTAVTLRRRREIAIMKSLGATRAAILGLVLVEAFVVAVLGGGLGWLASLAAAEQVAMAVFGASITRRSLLLPLALGSALAVAGVGSVAPLRRALRVRPAVFLKEAR